MKKGKILEIVLLSLAATLVIFTAVVLIKLFSGYEVYSDIKYADADECVMDIYIPKSAYGREKNGAVLFIHGGSWSGGDKSEETARCRLLASHGYIVANINYTLWSEDDADEYNASVVMDEIDMALNKLNEFGAERFDG